MSTTISCIIIDDEPSGVAQLESYVNKLTARPGSIPFQVELATTNPREGLTFLLDRLAQGSPPTVVFLDVQMPDLTGVEFIHMVRRHKATAPPQFVLATGYSDYLQEGFDLAVFDYLTKPIGFSRFLQTIERLEHWAQVHPSPETDDKIFFVKSGKRGRLTRIDFRDISMVESMKNYISIHTSLGPVMVYLTMKQFEEQLPADWFVRIHKSYLVNLHKIVGIEEHNVVLAADNRPPLRPAIGESYRAQLMQRLQPRIIERSR